MIQYAESQLPPQRPKSLANPQALAARRSMLEAPHLHALRELAARIARETGAAVPNPDPLDGGIEARLLLLLETPGPTIGRTGFVSRDNVTGTAANLFRFLAEAEIERRDTLIWNAVPWVIHAEGALNRAPRPAEVKAGQAYLAPLLEILPRLDTVVLAGRVAGAASAAIGCLRPDLPIITIPHPSPTYVCTSPNVRTRILNGLHRAAAILACA